MDRDRATADTSNRRVFWTTAALVVALDIATKLLAEAYLPLHTPSPVIGDFARLTLIYNPGAAFSMSLGEYSRLLFGAFAVGALFVLHRLYRQSPARDRVRVVAIALAFGGAAGNLVDRFRSPAGVVDFIDIGIGTRRFWTFNVADSAVTIGAILLVLLLWREDRASARPASAAER